MVNKGIGCQHPLLSFSHTFRRTGGQKNEHTEASPSLKRRKPTNFILYLWLRMPDTGEMSLLQRRTFMLKKLYNLKMPVCSTLKWRPLKL